MSQPTPPDQAAAGRQFEQGYLAAQYLFGRRGTEQLYGLSAPSAECQRAAAGYANADRTVRAKQLATGLAQLRVALDARRLK